MGFEEFYEIKTWIKFVFLGIPLVVVIFMFAPSLKWKFLLSFSAIIGLVIALSGSTIGKKHGFPGRR